MNLSLGLNSNFISSILNNFAIGFIVMEWSLVNSNMHIPTCFFKDLTTIVHFLTTNLQKRISLLKQWNNKKLIRTWVLLHQMVVYLLAFQNTFNQINTFEPFNFLNTIYKKSPIFCSKLWNKTIGCGARQNTTTWQNNKSWNEATRWGEVARQEAKHQGAVK